MNYEEKYRNALERARTSFSYPDYPGFMRVDVIFPELKEKENENVRIRKAIIACHDQHCGVSNADMIAWLEKQGEPKDKGEISDGYHTFNELYRYRLLYNAAFFNLLPTELVHKSKRHHDGEECFGGGWFIVMANLPTGQISNHYELKDWDLFKIPEKEVADEWDGHTPQEAANRLYKYLLEKQGEKTHAELSQQKVTKTSDQELSDKMEPKKLDADKLYDEVTKPHWISVEERKPKFKHKNDEFRYSETVIVTDGEYCTSANWAHSTLAGWYGWFDRGAEELNGVTHWMPMPQPPTVAKNATVKKGGEHDTEE